MILILDPYIELLEVISQTNQKIINNQISLKNRLIRKNTEKELLRNQEKNRRGDYGKRASS